MQMVSSFLPFSPFLSLSPFLSFLSFLSFPSLPFFLFFIFYFYLEYKARYEIPEGNISVSSPSLSLSLSLSVFASKIERVELGGNLWWCVGVLCYLSSFPTRQSQVPHTL